MTRKLEKQPLRILIATYSPLLPEYGAAQMAINLGQALKDLGHSVALWSPHPIPKNVQSWNYVHYLQRSLQAYLEAQPDFDIIDCQSSMISSSIHNKALIISRNVQPDLLYLFSNLSINIKQDWKNLFRLPLDFLNAGLQAVDVIRGWSVADQIYCLGTHELRWMEKWFPYWRNKLAVYYNAISAKDQEKLEYVRLNRLQPKDEPIKFLWIGRWVRHKGIAELRHFIESWIAIHPQDSFTIAGCGDCQFPKSLFNLCESNHINIIPRFSRAEIFNLLAKHHIGLFSSRVEGWGLSLNEMLESGMPVFATSAGGVEDLRFFMGNRLKSFPPTFKELTNIFCLDSWPTEYYQRFTWKSIAEQYLKNLIDLTE